MSYARRRGQSRERLRRQREQLLLYPAAGKALALKHAPPEVLALCQELPCTTCRQVLVLVRDCYEASLDLARRLGVTVTPLCFACYEDLADGRPTLAFDMRCPDITAALRRFAAQKN
jgi:hypothetical protein